MVSLGAVEAGRNCRFLGLEYDVLNVGHNKKFQSTGTNPPAGRCRGQIGGFQHRAPAVGCAQFGGTGYDKPGRMDGMTKAAGARQTRPKPNGPEHLLGANSEIARKLDEYYKSLLSDEVPDHLTQLLARLERAESEQKKG
ncbi:hypothetical protein MesoLjLc_22940 [Mesorhizobium sp. L-8-10]|nr:hypothetical protein MesoLjLc_22940 [Mesorhizobium sp. L-8-10]